jgi:hypothetical protein
MEVVIGGIYTHFKNPDKKYKVIGIALHTETEEEMVVYEPLYENPVAPFFTRPLKMFIEEVEWPKGSQNMVPRFTLQK